MTNFNLDELKKVKLYTNEEKIIFKKLPDKNLKYAIVTLIMINDTYIPGAIILAKSLINCKTKADLICLVTHKISDEGIDLLSKFYIIKKVDPIEIKTLRNTETLNKMFTKFHIFSLINYDKLLFIDADSIFLKYPDSLFTLDTPAGIFFDKNDYISYDENSNYILPDNYIIKWYDKFPYKHGKLIPKHITDSVLYTYWYGMAGGLFLIKPSIKLYKEIIHDLNYNEYFKYFFRYKSRWPDQQYLSIKFSGQWKSINPIFFGLQGYPHYSVLYSIQYAGIKPFTKIEDYNILYDDFKIWYFIYFNFIDEYKEYKNNKLFQIVENNIDKFNLKKNDLKNLYNWE